MQNDFIKGGRKGRFVTPLQYSEGMDISKTEGASRPLAVCGADPQDSLNAVSSNWMVG
jgi:hypothetical protein